MNAGALVYLARTRAGLSQASLGAAAGIAQNAVSRIERGDVDPAFDTVVHLVRACGLEPEIALVAGDESLARDIRRSLALSPAERLERAVASAHAAQAIRRAAVESGID